ncbi:MBL fold metallo-hydrolase [Calderihabitans maritimus]|uniref:Beta-lactamase domain-containing protein n=1 Tax=Calderihabitans maritimus TaxID=1246530 RepID=A0A1Z5HQP7_9FIRM|nr:MBL fold metallo-hydrolase [Calderihabitans maritimus]GAW91849.1 beta-lactamase domain-containing protein [Calderihabitans maritimus]
MSKIEDWGIHKVTLPLPFELDHINCYALKGNAGWSIVDCGVNIVASKNHWLDFMRTNNIRPEDIKAIYVTHYHPDHYGAAGWLQKISGAPIYMSSPEARAVEIFQKEKSRFIEALNILYQTNGMPTILLDTFCKSLNEMGSLVEPVAKISIINSNEKVKIGNLYFQIINTPGHADGHLCFYNEQFGILISGDQLLPEISPNISLWPGRDPNPLGSFLQSLQQLRQLPIKLVLPAHGQPFRDPVKRIDQIEGHHRERLKQMRQIAAQGATAYEIVRETFNTDLSPLEMRLAMGEVLAHLAYLVHKGELKVKNEKGVNVYHAVD